MSLSVVIITKNEEDIIGMCLDAIATLSDDIIVVDSGSTDKTESICLAKKARFIPHFWEGYSRNKNFGIGHTKYDWVLSIDADEILNAELVSAIQKELLAPTADAYNISFKNVFLGKPLDFGSWVRESHVRLFKKENIRWKGDIHEKLTLERARIGKLGGHILHYSVRSLEQYMSKKNVYTTLAAEDMYSRGKKAGFVKIFLSPIFHFVRDYVIKLGFLDGLQGFILATEGAHYVYLKYSKLALLQKNITFVKK
jgi:glycosyltransferase involved in cell wall biosynthesis